LSHGGLELIEVEELVVIEPGWDRAEILE